MNIDSCYEDVIAKLTNRGKIESVSQKLLTLTSNDARVLYVYNILKSLNVLPKALEVTKAGNVSTYYRNQGNHSFQKKDDYKAWQYYNLSLLHAPLDSDDYSLSIANRSAVYFSLQMYKECLNDISEVFSLKYPEKLKEKLNKRQNYCEEYLSKENNQTGDDVDLDINKIITLEGPRHARYPCASTKLEVVFSEDMGRHIIAREDLKVGEILVQEDPYFTLLLKTQILFSCSYCLSRSPNLLPCDKCCFALYCSAKCKENAWRDYHSIECNLMPLLMQWDFTKLELLALRTIIKARNDHSSWDTLFDTMKEAESNMNTEFRGHVKVNDEYVYDSKYYTPIHMLTSNIEKRSISDIFRKSVTAAVFLHLLTNYTDFLKGDRNDQDTEIQKCVADTLLLHIMTSPTNMHGLSTSVQRKDGSFVDEISLASAPYAFLSLFNHSCYPNVVRCSKLGTGQMTLYTIRPIKKGKQLFDNYGTHHALEELKSRQRSLKFQYKFSCLCEACLYNWPLYMSMTPSTNVPLQLLRRKENVLDSDAMDNLQNGHKGTALKLFKPLCELIEELNIYAPCVELADCQEALKQCLVIFKGLLLYGFGILLPWNALPPVLK